jgi:GT2 family glycosyltransferase
MSVDVVVVTYASAAHLEACLGALPDDVHPVVVDNDSPDGTPELAERLGARVLRNGDNRGFAAAANQGARVGSAELVLLLNPDAVLREPDLRALEQAFADDAGLGAASPRVLRSDGGEQRAAWPLPSPARTWLEALGLHRLRPATDGYLIGACLCVRRAAFAEVGGFDERFWLYGEDADLGRRLADAGWSFRVVRDATARHVGGASGHVDTSRTFEHFQRGAELYVEKHHGRAALASHRLGLLVGSALRLPLLAVRRDERYATRKTIVARLARALTGRANA